LPKPVDTVTVADVDVEELVEFDQDFEAEFWSKI